MKCCHYRLKVLSLKRIISLIVSAGHPEFATDHNLDSGWTGTIIYANGSITYNPSHTNGRQPPELPAANAATPKKKKGEAAVASSSSTYSNKPKKR
jgi:hypothetical protein